jgi:hypothetical protein
MTAMLPASCRSPAAGSPVSRSTGSSDFLVQLGSNVEIIVKPRSRATRRARVMVA